MVKSLRRWTIFLVIALALALLSWAGWLLDTVAGNTWLLSSLSRHSSMTLQATIEQPLWSGLRATDLRITWTDGGFDARELQLDWQPWKLLGGAVRIDTLRLDAPRLHWEALDEEGSKTPAFAADWPELPGWLKQLAIEVEHFELTSGQVQPPQNEPITIPSLSASLFWRDNMLQLNHRLQLEQQQTLTGRWQADFARHALNADLALSREGSQLLLNTALEGRHPLAGPLSGSYRQAGDYGATFSARLALSGTRLEITEFELQRLAGPDRVSGSGHLDWQGDALQAGATLDIISLDLAPETGWTTRLDGTLEAELNGSDYAGTVSVANRRDRWEGFALTGRLKGNWEQLSVSELNASWLRGKLSGELDLAWHDQPQLAARLALRHLDPQAINRQLQGDINADLRGEVTLDPEEPLSVSWQASFPASRLSGYPFSGSCSGSLDHDDLTLSACRFQNRRAHLEASGTLSQRLDLDFAAPDLDGFVPDAGGSVVGSGWVSYRDSQLFGSLEFAGDDLAYRDMRLQQLSLAIDVPVEPAAARLSLDAAGFKVADTVLSSLEFRASGSTKLHDLSLNARWPQGELSSSAQGSWSAATWHGELLDLSGRDQHLGRWMLRAPARIVLGKERLTVGALELAGEYGETLSLDLERRGSHKLSASAAWNHLSLAHFNPWLKGPELDGETSGALRVEVAADRQLDLSAHLTAQPTLSWNGTVLDFQAGRLDVDWGAAGLSARGGLRLARGGSFELHASSPVPGRLAIPDRADIQLTWQDLPLMLVEDRLFENLHLEGLWSGEVSASLQPGSSFRLRGSGSAHAARLVWRQEGDWPPLTVEQLVTTIDWSGTELQGRLQLELADFGSADARLVVPLTAAFPPAWQPERPWSGEVTVDVPQLELLERLWPNTISRSTGRLRVDARLAGTPGQPAYTGEIELHNGACDIIPAGIRLDEASLQAKLSGDRLELTSLSLSSGEGKLHGSGMLQLSLNGKPPNLDFLLQGENFHLVELPNLDLSVSPDLRLSGEPGGLKLEGQLTIPRLLINQPDLSSAVTPSEDIVLAEQPPRERKPYEKLARDLKIKLTLGEHVVLKVKGLDARLTGNLLLQSARGGDLTGRGEIQVADGRYAAYGITLPITRGRLLFGGGPVEEPNLDVLAERTIDKIRAGIEVSGTPRKPRIRLVSEPAMADTDILAYIVLGRPLQESRGQGQADAMMLAAGALLSRGESAMLRDRLSRQLGIDEISVRNDGGVENTVITVGKYLTPDIYLSYGRGLSSESGMTQLRYRINEQWQMESELGTVSGADLFYRIELP